jgi:isoleucyl-tRNA synthetase
MYRNLSAPLKDAPESVHLCDWPTPDETLSNEALIADAAGVQQAVSLGHSARKDSKIKVRQPLAKVMIQAPTPEMRAAVESQRETILEELNVKALELLDDAGDLVSYSLKANLPKLGKKLGKQMGAVRGVLENASPADARTWGEAARRGESVSIEVNGETLELAPDEILVSTQQSGEVSFASENGWAVALDTQLSPELISEGHARDFIRAIQSARKDAGLEVSDKIAIIVASNTGDAFDAMLENFGDLVQDETLAEELRLVDPEYPELADIALGEETVRFRVEKITAPLAEELEAAE